MIFAWSRGIIENVACDYITTLTMRLGDGQRVPCTNGAKWSARLPKPVREALGMADGGRMVFSVEGSDVKLASIGQSIKRAQDLYRQHATQDFSVDDFIAERQTEAVRENKL